MRFTATLLITALIASLSATALGQETSPEPETAAPAPPPLIAVAEVPARGATAKTRLGQLSADLEQGAALEKLQEELTQLGERVRAESDASEEILAESPGLAHLGEVEIRWGSIERPLSARQTSLEARAHELGAELLELETLADVWQRTEANARVQHAPASLLGVITETQSAIRRVRKSLIEHRRKILELESHVAELLGTVNAARDQVKTAREHIVENAFVRNAPALWSADATPDEAAIDDQLRIFGRELVAGLRAYATTHGDLLALHALLLMLALWLVFRARATVVQGEQSEAATSDVEKRDAEETVRHYFDRPISAALVPTLLATGWIHPDAPAAVRNLAGILILIPLVRTLSPMLGDGLRPLLFASAGFFLADRLRQVLSGLPWTSRWVFTIQMAVAALGLVWMLRSARLEQLPPSLRGSAWLRAIGIWARLALVTFVIAFLGAALGYTGLAFLLGEATLGSFYAALVLYAAVRVADGVAEVGFRGRTLQRLRMIRRHPELFVKRSRLLLHGGALLLWLGFLLGLLAIRDPVLNGLKALFAANFGYGTLQLSLGGLAAFGFAIWLSWWAANAVRFALEEEIYPRVSLPRGLDYTLSTIARYAVLIVGFFVAMTVIGFNTDRLTLLFGALGVGIGFGLQNVVNNFVSGLILLFERPVQVGDRVQLTDLMGDITRIGIRSSTVRTTDGAEVIVPNANLISEPVVNWTLSDRMRRVIVPIGVAYGSDPARVIELLRGVATEHPAVLSHPQCEVLFIGFGESSLDFEIRVWTGEVAGWLGIRSDLAVGVNSALAEANIEIPFPQRDLHLRSVDDGVRDALRGDDEPR